LLRASLAALLVVAATGAAAQATGSMATGRISHTATALADGTVLVAGGYYIGDEFQYDYRPPESAEIYDSATGTFSLTGSLWWARSSHTATTLADGTVLVVGGENNIIGLLASAEIYDLVTGTFSSTGSLATTRSSHTATALADGTVLVAGGGQGITVDLASAEVYDPATGTWR
jgi:hypothetical protein